MRADADGLLTFGRRVTDGVMTKEGPIGRWRGRFISQRGQGMVEYAFILVLISIVVVVMLITTGGQIKNLFSDITYALNNQAGL